MTPEIYNQHKLNSHVYDFKVKGDGQKGRFPSEHLPPPKMSWLWHYIALRVFEIQGHSGYEKLSPDSVEFNGVHEIFFSTEFVCFPGIFWFFYFFYAKSDKIS